MADLDPADESLMILDEAGDFDADLELAAQPGYLPGIEAGQPVGVEDAAPIPENPPEDIADLQIGQSPGQFPGLQGLKSHPGVGHGLQGGAVAGHLGRGAQPEIAEAQQVELHPGFLQIFIEGETALSEMAVHRGGEHIAVGRGAPGRGASARAREAVEDQKIQARICLQDMVGAGQAQDAGADHHDVRISGHVHALP